MTPIRRSTSAPSNANLLGQRDPSDWAPPVLESAVSTLAAGTPLGVAPLSVATSDPAVDVEHARLMSPLSSGSEKISESSFSTPLISRVESLREWLDGYQKWKLWRTTPGAARPADDPLVMVPEFVKSFDASMSLMSDACNVAMAGASKRSMGLGLIASVMKVRVL